MVTTVMIPSVTEIPLGLSARKSISFTEAGQLTRVTFRVRPGNGYYGAKVGVRYQDCMTHYTPFNRQTVPQQANRAKVTAGVAAWQALTEPQKQAWRDKAAKTIGWTGYHLFMSEYLYSH